MDDNQKRILLKAARDSVLAAVRKQAPPAIQTDDPELNAYCGCFVTLKSGDQLRGCIGQFISYKPLVDLVVEMAKASSTMDSRFFSDPITPAELNRIDIEISVLSPLKKTDNPLSLRLGVDGIYIKNRGASGCFLPQVAAETGWDKEQFLSYCCSHKAGLAPDAWKNPDTKVYLFTAEVFGSPFSDIK